MQSQPEDIRGQLSEISRCTYRAIILGRRLPKRGFKNRNTKEIIAINVDVLNRFEDGAEVTAESLLASGAISKIADGVKILGNGELTKKLNVKVNAVSETAKSKIEAAGGTVEVI